MSLKPGSLYKTKTEIVFFNQLGEVEGFGRSIKIPKDSIVLLLDVQPGKRHTMFTLFWDNRTLKREIGIIPSSWFEEVEINVSSS